ncbi:MULTISPECIES: hypothetical protein [unclassified Pseudoalteromonas]|uniref:hypothetical protein n=1 Tax=unclassified Pseudoalteromonas TaxID=194690 RepID=UPI0006941037|nr:MULTISPECIES: hypothetical protein [unclassified Pseudoalteromonas]
MPPALAVTLIGSSPTHPFAKYVLVAIPFDVVIGELNVALGVGKLLQPDEKFTVTASLKKLF